MSIIYKNLFYICNIIKFKIMVVTKIKEAGQTGVNEKKEVWNNNAYCGNSWLCTRTLERRV